MERYISPDEIVKMSSVTLGKGFSDIELAATLARMEEEKKTIIWNVGIGGSMSAEPLVVEDRIYIGACDKNFYCIDASTGKEIWRFSVEGPVAYTASHDDGVIYFASYDINLYAL